VLEVKVDPLTVIDVVLCHVKTAPPALVAVLVVKFAPEIKEFLSETPEAKLAADPYAGGELPKIKSLAVLSVSAS
jgi:hypothetical protein